MPCYNSERFLGEAITSVVKQKYTDWELLICDDGSSDDSKKIAERWASKDSRIKVLENKFKKGASGARNSGLLEARGRYIAFLDSDDIWLPNKLEQQISFMKRSGASFVFGYCDTMSENGEIRSTIKAPASVSLSKLIFCNFLPCLTVIYDAKKLGKIEQPDIKKRNDFALWLRILRENKEVEARCFPAVVGRYRVNSYGLSANKLSGINYFYRCLRQYAGLNIATTSVCIFVAIGFKGLKTLNPRMYNMIVSRVL